MTELLALGETALRLSPPRDRRLETADQLDVWVTGTASNVSVAASRLGTDTLWVSKTANTPLSKRAISELRGNGLDIHIAWADSEGTRQGLTFYESGNKPRDSTVIDDRSEMAIQSIEPSELPMSRVQQSQSIFISSETLASGGNVATTAQAAFRASGGNAVLSLNHRPSLWSANEAEDAITELFPAVDVFIANEDDINTVLNKQGDPSKVVHTLASEWDFETVIMTRGKQGATAWHDATIHERDAIETEAVDPTGQHDAFIGGYLSHRLANKSIGSALSHGIGAAALARTIPGPVPTINASEVNDLITDLSEGEPGEQSTTLASFDTSE